MAQRTVAIKVDTTELERARDLVFELNVGLEALKQRLGDGPSMQEIDAVTLGQLGALVRTVHRVADELREGVTCGYMAAFLDDAIRELNEQLLWPIDPETGKSYDELDPG